MSKPIDPELQKIIDTSADTRHNCADLISLINRANQNEHILGDELLALLEDFGILRYRMTLSNAEHSVVELLSREWDNPSEALADILQARKLLKWIYGEYKSML